jgi:hypothetical protein
MVLLPEAHLAGTRPALHPTSQGNLQLEAAWVKKSAMHHESVSNVKVMTQGSCVTTAAETVQLAACIRLALAISGQWKRNAPFTRTASYSNGLRMGKPRSSHNVRLVRATSQADFVAVEGPSLLEKCRERQFVGSKGSLRSLDVPEGRVKAGSSASKVIHVATLRSERCRMFAATAYDELQQARICV